MTIGFGKINRLKDVKLLWLDDYRNPFDKEVDWMVFSPIGRDCEVVWVKSYYEFVKWIENNGLPDAICFDHDLGKLKEIELRNLGYSKAEARKAKAEEKTGYDAAKWLVNYCMEKDCDIPKFNIQSSNPVGKENITSYLMSYHNSFYNT